MGTGFVDDLITNVRAGTAHVFETAQNIFSATGQTLITGPYSAISQSGSPVWMMSLMETGQSFNFLTFEYEFLSLPEAEGWLSVYFDNTLIYEADERYALTGVNEVSLWLGHDYAPGSYWFAYRLDPFSEVQSVVEISNVTLGFAEERRVGTPAPEPKIFMLGALSIGGLSLALSSRRRLSRDLLDRLLSQ